MVRRHTTDPVKPVSRVAPIAPVALHRMGWAARLSFATAQRFYRDRLRRLAASARRPPA